MAVDSPVMARPKKVDREGKPTPNPSDEVRYVGKMTREQRSKLRLFCDQIGRDMDVVGVEWIMERLDEEMHKRGWSVELGKHR